MRQLSDAEAASVCPFTHEARPRGASLPSSSAGNGGRGDNNNSNNNNGDEEGEEEEDEVDLSETFVPIWQLLPWPLFAFEGSRAGARALASSLGDREGEVGRIARAAVEEAARAREAAKAKAKKKKSGAKKVE